MKQRGGAQIRRYALPAAIGAAGGALLGDKEHGTRGLGALGGLLAGAAGSRQVNAVVRNWLLSPEARRLAAEGLLSGAEGLADVGGGTQLAPSFTPEISLIANAIRQRARPKAAQLFEAAKEDER